jgi:hypothetical protein
MVRRVMVSHDGSVRRKAAKSLKFEFFGPNLPAGTVGGRYTTPDFPFAISPEDRCNTTRPHEPPSTPRSTG